MELKYSALKPEIGGKQEEVILQMCREHFGKKPPYSMVLREKYLSCFLKEIRGGEVCVAKTEDGAIAGVCVVCPSHIDERARSYAVRYDCAYYLAAIIVEEAYRRQGHAEKLLAYALEGKKGNLVLITPERNVASIGLYKKCGMKIVDAFDQTEQDINSGDDFNLRRVVMVGDVFTTE